VRATTSRTSARVRTRTDKPSEAAVFEIADKPPARVVDPRRPRQVPATFGRRAGGDASDPRRAPRFVRRADAVSSGRVARASASAAARERTDATTGHTTARTLLDNPSEAAVASSSPLSARRHSESAARAAGHSRRRPPLRTADQRAPPRGRRDLTRVTPRAVRWLRRRARRRSGRAVGTLSGVAVRRRSEAGSPRTADRARR
jgi:hypothetical protein